MQNAEDTDAFELVNQADWQHLMTFYGAESSLPELHPAWRCVLDCQTSIHCCPICDSICDACVVVGIATHACRRKPYDDVYANPTSMLFSHTGGQS